MDYFLHGNDPNECTIVSLEGRMYPVEVAYLAEPTPDYTKKAAEVVWNINLQVSESCDYVDAIEGLKLCAARSWGHLGIFDWARRH